MHLVRRIHPKFVLFIYLTYQYIFLDTDFHRNIRKKYDNFPVFSKLLTLIIPAAKFMAFNS